MTQRRREEMAGYRWHAVQRETRRRSKQREQLVAKVQSIVAEVEVGSGDSCSMTTMSHLGSTHV
jgi:hypothetical protein